MQNVGRKNSLINPAIFLLATLIEVIGVTLLRFALVDSGLDDISVIAVGLFFFSFWTSGIVIGLRKIYQPRNYSYFPFANFLGNALLLAVIGLLSTQIIYLDTGRKYEFNLKKDYLIDTITVRGGFSNDGPILSQINDPDRVQKITNFVNSRGKRWHPILFERVQSHFMIEFYSKRYGIQYMGAERNPDTLYNEGPGEFQYYVELTPEEAKYFYDLLGAAP